MFANRTCQIVGTWQLAWQLWGPVTSWHLVKDPSVMGVALRLAIFTLVRPFHCWSKIN
jgi:hypothetical protein